MTDADTPLAAEFPPTGEAQWRHLVEGVLKGRSFEKTLVHHTADGIAIQPLYRRAQGASPLAGRTPGSTWGIVQRIDHPDPAEANRIALTDLENGANGVSLVFAGSPAAHGFGLPVMADAVAAVLKGVYLDAGVTVAVDAGPDGRRVAGLIAAYVKAGGIDPRATDIRFGLDPVGTLAATGGLTADIDTVRARFAATVADLMAQGFAAPVARADGRIVHAAGGSEAQELAFVLASAVAYLRALEQGGVALDRAAGTIEFMLAADADQFLTIAKMRAIRVLWQRVQAACGLDPKPATIAAETAWRMMTQRDPWVNLLRTTVATFAAGIGGADRLTVLPLSQALGLPDDFGRRLARNTHLVLIEESNLHRVADPAAGAGGYEALTRQLAEAAWALFQEIEAAGGVVAALMSGLLQTKVAGIAAAREKQVATRKAPLTGTSEFPHVTELPVATLKVAPPALPARKPAMVTAVPMTARRLAEPFERLRDAADMSFARTGRIARIFLATLGPVAAFTARATFARAAFEAGGVEAIVPDGFASTADMAAAFAASGTKVACLCSSDMVYAEEAVAAAAALKQAGATHLWLAGRPGEMEAALRAAGIGQFIYTGCDLIVALTQLHRDLDVSPVT
jgi:methylmalonyl-CoA mutase